MMTWGKVAKTHMSAALLLFILMFFQNCGPDLESLNSNNRLLESGNDQDCLSALVDCGPNPDFLEIITDLSNPSIYRLGVDPGIDVHGRCNAGNYTEHFVYIRTFSNSGDLVDSLELYNGCVRGRYSETIAFGTKYDVDRRYFVRIEIKGVHNGSLRDGTSGRGVDEIDFSLQN